MGSRLDFCSLLKIHLGFSNNPMRKDFAILDLLCFPYFS